MQQIPHMKTGFSNNNYSHDENFTLFLQKLIIFFGQQSIEYGTYYSNKAGRDNLSSNDIIYAMKYLAHEILSFDNLQQRVSQINDFDPSDNDDESDNESDNESDDESDDESDKSKEYFTRAPNTDSICHQINNYNDSWDAWNPTNELEIILKLYINKSINQCSVYNME